jgi:hypothetical protein
MIYNKCQTIKLLIIIEGIRLLFCYRLIEKKLKYYNFLSFINTNELIVIFSQLNVEFIDK